MSNAPAPSTLLQAFSNGEIVCPACHKHAPRAGLEPCTTTKCPACGAEIFVPRLLGDYFLYALLGIGGMGAVYKAIQTSAPDNAPVAVKTLSPASNGNPADISALLNEARVAELFTDSEFIAGCLAHGCVGGEYYTVSPCIEGERLDRRIQRLETLPESDVLKLALHLLAAEQHIYRRGFLFRDMKPENVIINQYGYAILLDFGLCLPVEQVAQPSGSEYIAGSPYYIPPERLLGEAENAASEIYSIGMILYYALTGHNYFNADELDALVKRHVSGLRVSSAGKMAGIRQSLAILIDGMIRQENAERPQDFVSVADSIRAIMQEIS